ncbi:protein germ cell-less-like [Drosophila obscura]|uniref:protein germ cell-less-like n=1 Tax=Drosophila obscura TaxID=7282 RepID=UPI001BB2C4DF|nr:protein germ cell-less-like [Drosophila obscura]
MPNSNASDALQWYRQPRDGLHLSNLCEKSLGKSVSHLTATHYYHVACENEMQNLRKIVVDWFLVNLMDPSVGQPHLLRRIPIELMTELVASPNLYVVPGEKELYELLCMWMYLRIHLGSEPGDLENQGKARQTLRKLEAAQMTPLRYFAERYGPRGSFLETAAGQPYVKVFQKLRTQYLCISDSSVKELDDGRVLPAKWVGGHLLNSWLDSVLYFDVDAEYLPHGMVTSEFFLKRCNRLGIVLTKPSKEWWRWPNVAIGMDICGTMQDYKLKIRFEYDLKLSGLLKYYQRQQILVRGLVVALKEGLQLGHSAKSPIIPLDASLESGMPVTILEVNGWLPYPLKVSLNILIGVPLHESFKVA